MRGGKEPFVSYSRSLWASRLSAGKTRFRLAVTAALLPATETQLRPSYLPNPRSEVPVFRLLLALSLSCARQKTLARVYARPSSTARAFFPLAMYADRVAAGVKRSIKDRLNGNSDDEFVRVRQPGNSKRFVLHLIIGFLLF
ncbi:hypothetical protein ACLOJK_009719 [Asimina triloba]